MGVPVRGATGRPIRNYAPPLTARLHGPNPKGRRAQCSNTSLTPMEEQSPAVLDNMVTTAFTLDGYTVERNLGIVRGIIVRSRSVFGTLGASLQTLVGGDITLFTNLCEETRAHAFQRMAEHAAKIGANAVIGVRYDATEIMQGVTEVLCYGTAVVVKSSR
jgi:uncharacterized protein YbjQ (UPF0145 family)